ncbi:hypothetical protein [Salinicola socius]|uniref:Penicillin-binding protein activator LpoB n=1 Tax=Salinicola socius TaxID=404433 RepID=A0A1Q8SWB6_9GAMM|nr:hypothetical protein [Salinicola socius]OLO05727.1 hypothetical protein BTW07_01920 [Salinicola socius]
MKFLLVSILVMTLAGCAGLSQSPPDAREALRGLADNAARGLLETPPWSSENASAVTVLMRPAQVDASLPITPEALNEALARGLLSQENAPHVLDWAPVSMSQSASQQWLLQARLSAETPPLHLSDRILQPYRLQFDLSRPGDEGTHWHWQASGAVDLDALPSDDALSAP